MNAPNEGPAGQGGAQEAHSQTSLEYSTAGAPKEQGSPIASAGSSPRPEEKETAELLQAIMSCFETHISLPEGAASCIAAWVLFSHALDCFQVSPRLVLTSPMPGCGKTTVLSILELLVPDSLPTSNTSPAAIYRFLAKGRHTLLIDEADTFIEGKPDLANIMNSGYTKAMAFVLRTDTEKGFEPGKFPTWCAMVIALIGRLSSALESRSIIVPMRRARDDEGLRKVKEADLARFADLAKRARTWVASVSETLKNAQPAMPKGFANRDADNWAPLFAIADLAGHAWGQRVRDAAVKLRGDVEPAPAERLLRAIRQAFAKAGADKLSSEDLCKSIREQDDGLQYWQSSLAAALRPFGIRPKSVRIGNKTPKGYDQKQFEDVFARYIP